MRVAERFITLLKTLNPDTYEELCKRLSLLEATKQFLFTFAVIFAVMLLLFIPALLVGAPRIGERLSSFETFRLDGNVSAAAPVILLDRPLIAVDVSTNATLGKEKLLITKEEIQWKRYWLFGRSASSWDDLSDLAALPDSTIFLGLLFLAPSLAFWFGVFFFLKCLLLVLLLSPFVFLLPRLFRHAVSYPHAVKLSLFATTVMLMVEMLLFPFYRNGWIPLLLYLLFLAVGAALVGERKLSHHSKGHPDDRRR